MVSQRAFDSQRPDYKTVKMADTQAVCMFNTSEPTRPSSEIANVATKDVQLVKVKVNRKSSLHTQERKKSEVKSKIGPLSDKNGTLTQACKNMAVILNAALVSVFTVENTAFVSVVAQNGMELLEILEIHGQAVQKYLGHV